LAVFALPMTMFSSWFSDKYCMQKRHERSGS
jgi:hypothetical protein